MAGIACLHGLRDCMSTSSWCCASGHSPHMSGLANVPGLHLCCHVPTVEITSPGLRRVVASCAAGPCVCLMTGVLCCCVCHAAVLLSMWDVCCQLHSYPSPVRLIPLLLCEQRDMHVQAPTIKLCM